MIYGGATIGSVSYGGVQHPDYSLIIDVGDKVYLDEDLFTEIFGRIFNLTKGQYIITGGSVTTGIPDEDIWTKRTKPTPGIWTKRK